jgi:ABC-type bacteriocin/lantibiotic exporter with double-glycine peptidase domain
MSLRRSRKRLAPEVVQTSAMDCGPAALTCLAKGHGVQVSYGRLREACQTDVDGASIDALEAVAGQLGLAAEQVLIPSDHIDLAEAAALPAIVVVRHAETARHFVVVWSRVGPWLQVMDPAVGRRWVRADRFGEEVYRHTTSVGAADWRAWAGTEAFAAPLRARMSRLGLDTPRISTWLSRACDDPRWWTFAVVDAAVRLAEALRSAGGVRAGAECDRLLAALVDGTLASPDDVHARIPRAYWTVTPDPDNRPGRPQTVVLEGAVLLSVKGVTGQAPQVDAPPEVAAAVAEPPTRPLRVAFDLLRSEGLTAPVAVGLAAVVAVGALLLEALLFRGLFDVGSRLTLPSQRWAAAGLLVVFLATLLALHIPTGAEAMRLGRRLELRLRMQLLAKLPRLGDRYFHSRPVTDMAERAHALHLVRSAPTLTLQLGQTVLELILTCLAAIVLAPGAWWGVLLLALVAAGGPAMIQPFLLERDLRVRTHGAALGVFYLDALLGLAPIRAHAAEASVQRQHEHLLVEWARALGGLLRVGLIAQALQAMACIAALTLMLWAHFSRSGGVQGGDLLLVYWALKLPALGAQLNALGRQIPAHRNTLARLLEPLAAPDEPVAAGARAEGPAAVSITAGDVVAGGHTLLRELNLQIAAGEHVAIVGPSGAGKSSLLGLLLGWNRLAGGELQIDGAPALGGALPALRRVTAWVDPAVQIWNASLAENLAYAHDRDTPDRLAEAIDAARLRDVADRLPHGLRSALGEGGGRLSGGEGQRVRLGRALLTEAPRLVLLDEPFRGLDREQRRRLLDDARRWWSHTTLLCVTHDIEDTLGFDRVLVIEDGRIVEDGPPCALASRTSRFAELLAAERTLRLEAWGGSGWRRLHLERGALTEAA